MWQGIEAWGNAGLRQIPANQSVISLINATIEYANNGITTWKVGDLTTTGAIIKAKNSTFNNNVRTMEFMQYRYKTASGNLQSNISSIEDCTFNVNNDFRRGNDFKCHISMWGVDRVYISGSVFKSDKAFPFDQEKNLAIRAIDASPYIVAACKTNNFPCNSFKRNIFEGFNKGVYNSYTNGVLFAQVIRSDFNKNGIGIQNEGSYHTISLGNKFLIGNNNIAQSLIVHEGLLSTNATSLSNEANTFEPFFTNSTPRTIGFRVNNSGSQFNTVYRNTFKKAINTNPNQFFANLANGQNYVSNSPVIGLTYKCNTHINNIINGCDIAVSEYGIASEQGHLGNPTMNTFSHGNTTIGSDINNLGTTTTIPQPFNYYYLNSGNHIPLNYINVNIHATQSTDNSCYVSFDPEIDFLDDGFTSSDTTVYENESAYLKIAEAALDQAIQNNNISEIPILESRVLNTKNKKQIQFDKVIRSILLSQEGLNYTKLRHWLAKENTFDNYCAILETYLDEGNTSKVVEMLQQATTKFTLSESQRAAYDYYLQLKMMQVRWKNENINIFALGNSDLIVLRNLAQQSKGRAGDAARGLLNFAYNGQYFTEPVFPDAMPEKPAIPVEKVIQNSSNNDSKTPTLTAFPNPASHIVNFEYHTTDKTLNGESELLVRNPLGQVIKRIKMTSDGLVTWNIEELSSGIYYYSLENTEKVIIAAQQLIIAR
jgi:hypothetical protein